MHVVVMSAVDVSGKMDLASVLLLLTSLCSSSALAELDSQGSIFSSFLFICHAKLKLCKI